MILPLRLINKTTNHLINNRNVVKTAQFVPVYTKFYSTKVSEDSETITIGDVTKSIKLPKNPELVPQKYGKFISTYNKNEL